MNRQNRESQQQIRRPRYYEEPAPKRRRRNNNKNRRQDTIPQQYESTQIGGSIPYGSAIGTAVGTYLGGPVGGIIGSAVGSGAQSLIKRVTGFGDYQVSGNVFVTGNDAVPEFTNNERCTVVTHKEYIADVITGPNLVGTSTNFNIASYDINPGVNTSFPWLSNLAQNYEQYLIQGMVYEFKTNSAMAVSSTNTALGTVIMATQYNSLSPEFVNKQQMENYEFSQSCVPSESALHPIECDPKQTQSNGIFNVRIPVAVPGDPRLYNIGRFSIATQGMQAANVNIGELWVTYKVCLLKPRLSDTTFAPSHVSIPGATFTSVTSPFGANYVDNLISIAGPNVTFNPNFIGIASIVYVMRGGDAGSDLGSLAPATSSSLFPISMYGGPVNSLNSFLYADLTSKVTSGQQVASFGSPGGLGATFKLNSQAVTQGTTAVFSVDLWVIPWGAIPPISL